MKNSIKIGIVAAIALAAFSIGAYVTREYRLEEAFYSSIAFEPVTSFGPQDATGDSDVMFINSDGDTNYIWAEGATTYRGGPKGFYIGHRNGRFLALGANTGLWEHGHVVVRGKMFEIRPRMDQDSVFVIYTDSTTEAGRLYMRGDAAFGPDDEGDGEVFYVNASGDTGTVDMDNSERVFYLIHPNTGLGFGCLMGPRGSQGKWKVVGDFGVFRSVLGDSLLYVSVDSTNNVADFYLKGEMKIGPDVEGDGEIFLFNSSGDSMAVGMDNTRYTFIQHPSTGLAYGAMSGRNGRMGDWRAVGDFRVTNKVDGDTLFYVRVDSLLGIADVHVSGDLVVEGDFVPEPVGVFAYLSASDTTHTTTAAAWYPIKGTFVNSPAEMFSTPGTYIQYDNSRAAYFEIAWRASLCSDAASTTASITVKVNSTVYEEHRMCLFLKLAGEAGAVSGGSVIPLDPGDQVQVVVTSDKAGAVLTFGTFTTSIKKFFS